MVEKILIDSYDVFMRKSDYVNAFIALKKMWSEFEGLNERKQVYDIVKKFRTAVVHVNTKEAQDFYRRSFLLTAREIFDDFMIYIEWNKPLSTQFWLPRRAILKDIADALQAMEDDELDELFISLPPRVGKTSTVMFFLIWVILRDSESSNLFSSYSDDAVGTFYVRMLSILKDPFTYGWLDVFPERKLASTNAKARTLNIDTDKGYASFTGRSIDGSLNGSCDCRKYLVGDDLVVGIDLARSKARLKTLWSKVCNDFLTRGVGDKVKRIWIGTRWALSDPQGRRLNLLKTEPSFAKIRWKEINVPALNDKDESNFDYPFGVGNDTAYYRQIRAGFEEDGDVASWYAQFCGVPVERSGAVFCPDDMRFYNGVLPAGVTPDRIFMAIDPAWGGGDAVAGPVCVQYGNDIYIPAVIYNFGEKNVTQPEIVSLAIEYGVQAIFVEGTKMTSSYAEGINDQLKEKGHHINLQRNTTNYTGNGKEQRIYDKAHDIRTHMIFLDDGMRTNEYQRFMQNVYSFTVDGKNKHEDAPDSLAMAISFVIWGSMVAEVMDRPW